MRWNLSLTENDAAGNGHSDPIEHAESETDEAGPSPYGFHALVIPEARWSDDFRQFSNLVVRDGPNRPPLMGLIENSEAHERSVSIGSFERIELNEDGMWEGWGNWARTREAAAIRKAIRAGDVTGVSADVVGGNVEYLMEMPEGEEEAMPLMMLAAADEENPETEEIDGKTYLIVKMPSDRLRIDGGQIMGATVVPFPAYHECTIEDLCPEDDLDEEEPMAVAASVAPLDPPRSWFDPPRGKVDYSVVIEDSGRVHGYPAASWSSCHMSYPNECRTPPRSASGYHYFLTGERVCSDGSRVRTGPLTLRGGHAARDWSMARAMAHYDDTDAAFADVAIGEDSVGMWVAGALRPHIDPAEVRVAMASGFSGDWRPVGPNLELIALSCVNTRGFVPTAHYEVPKAHYHEVDGMVASLIIDLPQETAHDYEASAIEHIAASIGRSFAQRRQALYEKVHGG